VLKDSFELLCCRRDGHWQHAVTCTYQRLCWETDSDLAAQEVPSSVMKLLGSVPFPEDPATFYPHVPATSGIVASPFLSDIGAQVPGVMSPGQLNFVWLSLIF